MLQCIFDAILDPTQHIVTRRTRTYEQRLVSNSTVCQNYVPLTTLTDISANSVIESNVNRLNDPSHAWYVPACNIPAVSKPLRPAVLTLPNGLETVKGQ